jgi:hypothetical protein
MKVEEWLHLLDSEEDSEERMKTGMMSASRLTTLAGSTGMGI